LSGTQRCVSAETYASSSGDFYKSIDQGAEGATSSFFECQHNLRGDRGRSSHGAWYRYRYRYRYRHRSCVACFGSRDVREKSRQTTSVGQATEPELGCLKLQRGRACSRRLVRAHIICLEMTSDSHRRARGCVGAGPKRRAQCGNLGAGCKS
jgi:hypothetical protein